MNLFDDNPGLRTACRSAVARIEQQRARRAGGLAAKSRTPERSEHADVRRAFDRAEREDCELRRLKAQYPHWSGLYFKIDAPSDDSSAITLAAAD